MIGRIVGSLCLAIMAFAFGKMAAGAYTTMERMSAAYPDSTISNDGDWYFICVFICFAIGSSYAAVRILFKGELL